MSPSGSASAGKRVVPELLDASSAGPHGIAALLAHAEYGFAVIDADGIVAMANGALVRIGRWATNEAAVGSSLVEQLTTYFPTSASALRRMFVGSEAATISIGSVPNGYVLHADRIQVGLRTILICPVLSAQLAVPPGVAATWGHGERDQGNRQLLDRAIEQWRSDGSGKPTLALLLVSLDRFKDVNDTLGSQVSDELLELVAKRLQSTTREGDVVVHLNDDEFAVLNTSGEQPVGALSVGQRIVDLIGRAFLIKGNQVHIAASIGVAVLDAETENRSDLFRHADLAARSIKAANGGGVQLFEPSMREFAVRQRELEIALRRALALKEFVVHYQPQIDLTTQQIVGFEALIRWQSIECGMVSPAEFIPLAEQLGEICAIGEWVMRTACMEAARWPAHISIAVNVSPMQFERGDLVGMVRAALADSGLAPSRLEIEITEGLLMSDSPAVLEELATLQAMGLNVALDDFGTGFSSLSYLSSFPFSKLKIDRCFVQDESDRAQDLIRSILALGKSLGLTTLAEGIETAQQSQALLDGGCDSAQGFLFGRPIPAEALHHLIPRSDHPPA